MALLWVASLLWAFSFGLIKGQLVDHEPVVVAAGRLALAALVFAPLLVRRSNRLARPLVLRAAGWGVVQFGLMYVLYIASFQWLAAWQVAVLTVFTPLYVVALAALRGGGLTWRHGIAAVLAVVGALVVNGATPEGLDWRGVVLLQAANLCFAAGQLAFRDLQGRAAGRDAVLVGWMYAGAAGVTLLAAGLVLFASLPGAGGTLLATPWTASALASLLYLGVLPTGVGFYLWNRGAARTGAGSLAVANNLKVPLAVLVSWLVFGEQAAAGRVLGGLVVVVGALILARVPGHRN